MLRHIKIINMTNIGKTAYFMLTKIRSCIERFYKKKIGLTSVAPDNNIPSILLSFICILSLDKSKRSLRRESSVKL